jgi:hypothetical protein
MRIQGGIAQVVHMSWFRSLPIKTISAATPDISRE